VLALRYIDGLDFVELAERLGITAVAARQRAHRAREELVAACIEQTAIGENRSCPSVRSQMGRYLRGRLSRKVRAQMASHMASCDRCRRCYAELVDLYGHRLSAPERD
jgi:hypothetical protein